MFAWICDEIYFVLSRVLLTRLLRVTTIKPLANSIDPSFTGRFRYASNVFGLLVDVFSLTIWPSCDIIVDLL